jgi:hypothetical protein
VDLAPGVIDTGMQASIWATPEDHFRLRQRCLDMKRAWQLMAPDACAARLLDYLLSDLFGSKPVDDLRNA